MTPKELPDFDAFELRLQLHENIEAQEPLTYQLERAQQLFPDLDSFNAYLVVASQTLVSRESDPS